MFFTREAAAGDSICICIDESLSRIGVFWIELADEFVKVLNEI